MPMSAASATTSCEAATGLSFHIRPSLSTQHACISRHLQRGHAVLPLLRAERFPVLVHGTVVHAHKVLAAGLVERLCRAPHAVRATHAKRVKPPYKACWPQRPPRTFRAFDRSSMPLFLISASLLEMSVALDRPCAGMQQDVTHAPHDAATRTATHSAHRILLYP